MTALANRGSLNKVASGRTNQILSYVVFGLTRCETVYSSPALGMREQMGYLDLNLRKCCSHRHEQMSNGWFRRRDDFSPQRE